MSPQEPKIEPIPPFSGTNNKTVPTELTEKTETTEPSFFARVEHHPRLILLTTLLALVAFLTTIYLYNQNIQLANELSPTSNPTSQTETPTHRPTETPASPTTNWQTQQFGSTWYINENSFQIQIPPNWQLETKESLRGIIISPLNTTIAKIGNQDQNIPQLSIHESNGTHPNPCDTHNCNHAQEITINITSLNTTISVSLNQFEVNGNTFYTFHSNNHPDIMVHGDEPIQAITTDLQDIETFTQILSTFQFTDPTASWQTYINEEYNFSFKYPSEYTDTQIGPNDSQKQINNKQTISGTVAPSYETINFKSPSKSFSLTIYHEVTSKLIKENLEFAYDGSCGNQFADQTQVDKRITINNIPIRERIQTMGDKILTNYCFVTASQHLAVLKATTNDSFEEISLKPELTQILSTLQFTN